VIMMLIQEDTMKTEISETEKHRKKRKKLFEEWSKLGREFSGFTYVVSNLTAIVQNPMIVYPDDPALVEFEIKCKELAHRVERAADRVMELCKDSLDFVTNSE